MTGFVFLVRQATTLNRRAAQLSLHSSCRVDHHVCVSRRLSSKSKNPPQEVMDKAQELHAELKEMIEAQKAAEQTKLKQSNSSELFVNIFKSSKPQIINIFFAFVCALLAYQIRGLRQGYKRLLDDIEVKETEIDMLRKKLREVCEVVESENVDQGEESQVIDKQTLLWTVSEKCTRAISDIFSQSDRSPGYSWILARKLASGDVTETTRFTDAIKQIIKGEMQNAVGDLLWSKDELKQRRVMDLEAELNEVRDNAFAGDAQMSGLVEMLEQAHGEERMSGMKRAEGEDGKVKRTRYAI